MSLKMWAEELTEVLEVAIARGGVVSRGRVMQFCVTHMAPRVWTGEDNCVYRASWKASYPDPCNFAWMRFSFDVERIDWKEEE